MRRVKEEAGGVALSMEPVSCHNSNLKKKFQRLVSLGLKTQHLVKRFCNTEKRDYNLKKFQTKIQTSVNMILCSILSSSSFSPTHFQSSNNFTSAFAEFQIWHCSNSVFHCFPVLKPCKWDSANRCSYIEK